MKCQNCNSEIKEEYKFCPKCGALQAKKKICRNCKMELPPDAKYCLYCGTPQPKFCMYCNTELPSDALYCMQCGTKVSENFYESDNYTQVSPNHQSSEIKSPESYKYNLTELPSLLPSGTEGTAGSSSQYINFGDWPQTVKSPEVIINENAKAIINGWECYRGSDCHFYVKGEASPATRDARFSDGTRIEKAHTYYFMLEPIKWLILDRNYNKENKILLLSEKALDVGPFDPHGDYWNDVTINRKRGSKTVFPNNYEYSAIRAWLNSIDGTSYDVTDYTGKGFIDTAFSPLAKEKIRTVKVDNSGETIVGAGYSPSETWLDEDKNIYKYVCKDTNDKIFLLSEKEATDKNYGFDRYNVSGRESSRIRKQTDYAAARCSQCRNSVSSSDIKGKYQPADWWWLRSPYFYTSAYAQGVSEEGSADFHNIVCNPEGKIVPALVIDIIHE